MKNQLSLSKRLACALATPASGVVGLVDELLAASLEQDLQLGWDAGRCHVGFLNGGPADRIEVPVQKSVFRAVLARIAALCNERVPNSVTPYGGSGEVAVDADPATMIRVAFVNTPTTLRLELSLTRLGIPQLDGGQLLAVSIENSGASVAANPI